MAKGRKTVMLKNKETGEFYLTSESIKPKQQGADVKPSSNKKTFKKYSKKLRKHIDFTKSKMPSPKK